MELINNRYRVIKIIEQTYQLTSYLVADVIRGHKLLCFNIINVDNVSSNIIEIFNSEFLRLKNLNNSGVVNLVQYGLVTTIDNRNLKEYKYYYSTEYFDGTKDILKLADRFSFNRKLDLFADLCRTVNTFHLRGAFYGIIKPDNIYFSLESEDKIKLKDLSTIYIEKSDFWKSNMGDTSYRAPEVLLGGDITIESDIYSLGMILLKFFKLDSCILNPGAYSRAGEANSEREIQLRLIKIAEKMVDRNANNRYKSIIDVIRDINTELEKKYQVFDINEVEKLGFGTRLIGREYPRLQVMKAYEEMTSNHHGRFIGVHGEAGIGKTRFLKELRHQFKMSKVKVYTAYLNENGSESGKGVVDILKKMISECDSELLKQYEQELKRFVPEIASSKQMDSVATLFGEKEKFRILNRLTSFIAEFSKDKSVVIIIDNIHFASSFFIELLEYAYSNNLKDFILLFSYDDAEYSHNSKFERLLSRFKSIEDYVSIKLNPLTDVETTELIRSILSMPHEPKPFSKKIYSHTYGNPLFIEEVTKKLFASREIYVNRESGRWTTDYNIEDMPIPLDMEQAMSNQIKELDEKYIRLLDAISVFNNAVNIDIISSLSKYPVNETEEIISGLIKKGIILQKIDDRGFVFEFYNKILKKMIYSALGEEERKSKHELAGAILEKLIVDDDRDYKEELIYHMEMAGNTEKIIKYCIENADRFEKLNVIDAAIRNVEKAISMVEDRGKDIELIQLLIRAGDLYRQNADISIAIKYYKKAEKVAEALKQHESQIDALNNIASIYYDKSEFDESLKYLDRSNSILSNFEYIKGELSVQAAMASIYWKKQEFEKAFELCNRVIDFCGNDHLEFKGRLLNTLGNLYIDVGNIDAAMKSFNSSIQCFEKINYLQGTLNPLNNIGVIYGDYYQDDKKAIENFLKMREISHKYNLVGTEVTALVNIGETYFYKWQYEEALNWFKDALEKAERYNNESIVFYSYLYLLNTYLLLNDYDNACKYFQYSNNELLAHPEQGRNIADYYRVGASILYELGNLEKAEQLITKALERHSGDESVLKLNCEIIKYSIMLRQADGEQQLKSIINQIKNVASKFAKKENKLNVIYNTSIELYENGYVDLIKYILNSSEEEINISRIDVKKYYIEGVLSKGQKGITLLNKALDTAIKIKDKAMQWKIYNAIGDYYFGKRNYYYAVNYYFDSCEIIRDIVMSVPEKSRVQFLNFHNMNEPFYKLFLVKQHYNKEYEKQPLAYKTINSTRELNELFNYVDLRDILTNKYFIRSAQKIYDSLNGNDMKSLKDITSRLYSDPIKNLEIILKYLLRVTLAKKAYILREVGNRKLKVLASSVNDSETTFDNNYIIDRVRSTRQPLLVKDKSAEDEIHLELGITGARAVICIPVIVKKDREDADLHEERRYSTYISEEQIGYIYLESDKVLNNFNEDTLNKCAELGPFTGLIIEQHQLKISSSIDKLTGTLTRKFLEDALERQITQAAAHEKGFSIIIFDLDHFKGINDNFGHQTGDKVLKEVCDIALKSIRRIDSCGRYGGEEFIIILPDTDTEGAETLAEKLRIKIADSKILGDKRDVTVSMGISSYPEHGLTSQELIEKADQALYVAKEKGRNRYQVWKREFLGTVKGTDKLSGVISGNPVQDYRNVSVMVDLIELIKKDTSRESKIYDLLGRIIEITESQQGILFVLEEGKVVDKYSRKVFQEGWVDAENYSRQILNKVIEGKQGIFMIDWDEVFEYDYITGMPDWKSVAAAPLLNSGQVKAVLYLSVSTKFKEFKFDDLNFISVLAQMSVALL